MFKRLIQNWVYGGFLAGLLLLCLTPVFAAGWPVALLAVFLHLPVYMLHQYEEHDADRFAIFVNREIGQGVEVLSSGAVFIINIPGVWGVNAVSIWLAASLSPGYGLIGVYLTLVNALAHVGQAVAMRKYNPGLVTAVVLFLPLSVWSLLVIRASGEAGLFHHALGLSLAILIHAAIVAYVASRRIRGEVRSGG
jgi:Protein of unknown function with HXXEE motif